MQVTITKIKDTQRTSARTGKPFTSRGILTNEYGEKWLSGFAGKENAHWKEGDTVEVNVEQKGEYLNFTVPKVEKAPAGDLNRLEVKMDAHYAAMMTELQMIRGLLPKNDEYPDGPQF